jgi:hypothetical protein
MKATRKPPPAVPLNDKVLEELAEIARVPPENRPLLNYCVRSMVFIMHRHAERVELFSASDIRRSARLIADAATALDSVLDTASEGAREFVRLAMPQPPRTFADYQALTAALATAARQAAASRESSPWAFFRQMFIRWLLRDVADAGGALGLNERSPERSTLIKALEVLRPFMPAEFSAKGVSFSTLRRIVRGVKIREKPAAKNEI